MQHDVANGVRNELLHLEMTWIDDGYLAFGSEERMVAHVRGDEHICRRFLCITDERTTASAHDGDGLYHVRLAVTPSHRRPADAADRFDDGRQGSGRDLADDSHPVTFMLRISDEERRHRPTHTTRKHGIRAARMSIHIRVGTDDRNAFPYRHLYAPTHAIVASYRGQRTEDEGMERKNGVGILLHGFLYDRCRDIQAHENALHMLTTALNKQSKTVTIHSGSRRTVLVERMDEIG